MYGVKVTDKEIKQIVLLRQKGNSLPEIMKMTGKGSSTVFKYIQGVDILPEYVDVWRSKQGGSKRRARDEWAKAGEKALTLIKTLNAKERIIIAACLYWGEGAKKDLCLSNTDAGLIKVFVQCLKEIGIEKSNLRVTIRLYSDINRGEAIKYWAKVIGIPESQVLNVNVLPGKKEGKLKYGMCRIRVTKGGPYLKLIQSIIEVLKSTITPL